MRGNRAVLVAIVALLVAAVGVAVAVILGAGAYVALRGDAAADDSAELPADFVAIDATRVLLVEGERVRAMRRDGAGLSPLWESPMAPARAAHPWNWRVVGERIVAETHLVTGDGESSLEVFDATRGHVLSVPGLSGGAWAVLPNGDVAARTTTSLVLVRGDSVAWETPLGASEFLPQLSGSEHFIVVSDGALHVFDRESGAEQPLAAEGELVGFASTREEALLRQGDQVSVVALADGATRALDLGEPVIDDLSMPCLLGQHGGRWLLLYSTELTQSFQVGARSWSVPGRAMLAAVDPETGALVWRATVGNWEVACRATITESGQLAADDALPDVLMLRGTRSEESGSVSGHLLSVDAASGQVLWEGDYANESRANAIFRRHGDTVWMTIPESADAFPILLIRFDRGRLVGGVRLEEGNDAWGPALGEDAWVWGDGWIHLTGPTLTVEASGSGAGAVEDVRASIPERLGLPAAAR